MCSCFDALLLLHGPSFLWGAGEPSADSPEATSVGVVREECCCATAIFRRLRSRFLKCTTSLVERSPNGVSIERH